MRDNRRLTIAFWLFIAAATVSGGTLGRYLAALATGRGTALSLALIPVLAVAFVFSTIVLVRIVRASSLALVAARDRERSGGP